MSDENQFLAEIRVIGSKLDMTLEAQKEIKAGVDELRQTIFIGNAVNGSILSRLAKLEHLSLDSLDRIQIVERNASVLNQEDRKGRWQLIMLLGVSIIGWVGLAISQMFGGKVGDFVIELLKGFL